MLSDVVGMDHLRLHVFSSRLVICASLLLVGRINVAVVTVCLSSMGVVYLQPFKSKKSNLTMNSSFEVGAEAQTSTSVKRKKKTSINQQYFFLCMTLSFHDWKPLTDY